MYRPHAQDLLQCSDGDWKYLSSSIEMLELMQVWETKKTNYKAGETMRLDLRDALDVIDMDVNALEATVNERINPEKVRWIGRRRRRPCSRRCGRKRS